VRARVFWVGYFRIFPRRHPPARQAPGPLSVATAPHSQSCCVQAQGEPKPASSSSSAAAGGAGFETSSAASVLSDSGSYPAVRASGLLSLAHTAGEERLRARLEPFLADGQDSPLRTLVLAHCNLTKLPVLPHAGGGNEG
jgi:hypothetical protein